MSEVRERRPSGAEWTEVRCNPQVIAQAVSASAWVSGPISVISELALAQSPVKPEENVLQWHVSISAVGGKRPKPHHVRRALRAFGMTAAEEDNHYPGVARYFWLSVDPAHRSDCECKETESTVVEGDGYRWQNPKDTSECRGCAYQAMFGKPCAVHACTEAL